MQPVSYNISINTAREQEYYEYLLFQRHLKFLDRFGVSKEKKKIWSNRLFDVDAFDNQHERINFFIESESYTPENWGIILKNIENPDKINYSPIRSIVKPIWMSFDKEDEKDVRVRMKTFIDLQMGKLVHVRNNVTSDSNSSFNLAASELGSTYTKKEENSSSAQNTSPLVIQDKALNNILSDQVSSFVSVLTPKIKPMVEVKEKIIEVSTPVVFDKVKPETSEQIRSRELIPFLERALCASHDIMAELALESLKGRCFAPSTTGKNVIYWDERISLWMEGDIEGLVVIMSKECKEHYARIRDILVAQVKASEDEQFKTKTETTIKRIDIVSAKLGQHPYCMHVIKFVHKQIFNGNFVSKLDTNKDLLPIMGNKVINLREGIVTRRTKEHMFSFECEISHNINATCPKIERFLDCITCGDTSLRKYLQCILGLCLMGHAHTRQMYVFWGASGSNGKSTLMRMMKKVLGKFYKQVPKQAFIDLGKKSDPSAASPHLAMLRGCRMAVLSETDAGSKFDEEQIKSFTGADPICGRYLRENFIEFIPHFKPFLICNDKPQCSASPAILKRLVMIPFGCEFVDNPDPSKPWQYLIDKMFIETTIEDNNSMQAFLNWLIEGARLVYLSTIPEPECVRKQTQVYGNETNIYEQFYEEILDLHTGLKDKEHSIPVAIFNEKFAEWHRKTVGGEIPKERVTNFKRKFGEPKAIRFSEDVVVKCYLGCTVKGSSLMVVPR